MENSKDIIKFSDVKDQILSVLQEQISAGKLRLEGNFSIIDGFFFSTIQEALPGIQIGGTGIPQIAILHNDTGEIRYFAIKKLLPNLKI